MIIKPRIKGFLCTTAHPAGCERDVANQIAHVKALGPIDTGPRRVLIIGASGGYGLASRIAAAYGSGAGTVGVFFERPADGKRTASAGWYKSAAFTRLAHQDGLYASNVNGDAFSADIKQQTIDLIKRDLGQVDMVIYSLAAPQRQMPDGTVARSALKPIGAPFEGGTIDINSGDLRSIALPPATADEVADTVKVMGGEDWELWIAALLQAGVLAKGCVTTNYTYLGSEVTWPIYYHGTIGKAKEDLDRAARALAGPLAAVGGKAYVAVMKGLMTQAASAIPGMAIYLSLLFKVMKAKGTHEGCIEQTARLFHEQLYGDGPMRIDDAGRIRMDERELDGDTQAQVKANWSRVNSENLYSITDFVGYRQAFLQMHGFAFDGVDYDADADIDVAMALANR
jgi:enoyl-[acyl-carrier protein] reductase / trans-2-enoyl-CoA reductase (NAD+)